MSSAVSMQSYSTRRRVQSSSSLTEGMWTRTPSVYGGAGGYGTRVSKSLGFSSVSYNDGYLCTFNNEKMTMQNLNDRLASYLEKVHSLDQSNRKLELQIREFYEKRLPSATRDYSGFFATISDLKAKIAKRHLENQRMILQLDNAHLASDDFKLKYETEMNMRKTVEADVARLRVVRDGLTLNRLDLEMEIESLKDELISMKNNHDEEMCGLRAQQTGTVNVEVDSAESVDLMNVLTEVRQQYEALVQKYTSEWEKWFESKVETLNTHIMTSTEEVKTHRSELSSLKRTYQNLEITRESSLSEIRNLQLNLTEVDAHSSFRLSQIQTSINLLEEKLQGVQASCDEQAFKYNALLNTKEGLEREIEEYRRLLAGEVEKKKQVIISKVVEKVEEKKPHIERRVKTIVEEIVDGVVVTSVVDTQVEDIQ